MALKDFYSEERKDKFFFIKFRVKKYSKMIQINTEPIGEGWHRLVYKHPIHNDRAIKIVKQNGKSRQTRREIKIYKQLIKRNHKNWKHLPKYYGEIVTNKGTGIVVELVRDYDGKVSKKLDFYIKRDGFNAYKKEWEEFKSFFISEKILVGNDVSVRNILVKRIDKNKSVFVLIDSLGDHVLIPMFNNFESVVKKKVIRRLNRAEKDLLEF